MSNEVVITSNKVNATDFLATRYKKVGTRRLYDNVLRQYLSLVYGKEAKTPEQLTELANQYFLDDRNYETDVENFLSYCNDKQLAPKTISSFMSIVRVFLRRNKVKRVEPPKSYWEDLGMKSSNPITLDRAPTVQELGLILRDLPLQGKALFTLLASSGMRIGEALQLHIAEVELSPNPLETPSLINISGKITKNGESRIAFCSSEATELLKQWLKVRSRYLEVATARCKYPKKEDGRLFPFSMSVANTLWYNGCRRAYEAGATKVLDKDLHTGRQKLHIHALRKFFRTRMGTAIQVDVAEGLMGHEGYLTGSYRKLMEDPEGAGKLYLEGEHAVIIFSQDDEVDKLRKELAEKQEQLRALVDGLVADNYDLKNRMKRVEKQKR